MSELTNQQCALCGEHKLTLREEEVEIPFFGRVYILSMDCSSCGYRKADVEPAEQKEPQKYTLEVTSDADLNIRIIKSAEATINIPKVITIESGPASEGYITNVEGLLERIKGMIQSAANDGGEEDSAAKTKAKNLIKKLNKVLVGREPLKIIIEDPSGHSAIISDKVQKSKL